MVPLCEGLGNTCNCGRTGCSAACEALDPESTTWYDYGVFEQVDEAVPRNRAERRKQKAIDRRRR